LLQNRAYSLLPFWDSSAFLESLVCGSDHVTEMRW
jgi:hypothetical protein